MRSFDIRKLFLRALAIILLAPIFIAAVYVGGLPFFIGILVIVFIALQEMYHMYEGYSKKPQPIFYYGYIIAAALLLSVYMQETAPLWENYIFLGLSLSAVGFFIYELFRKQMYFLQNPLWYLIRSVIYIGVMASYLILLRDTALGLEYCMYLVGVVWVNDIFAYLIGIPLGKHKLSPEISPKKSIEGALGALLGAVLMATNMRFLIDINLIDAIFLGIAISVFAQVGDLVESLLKRVLKAKDSSQLIPGHGGVLDRLDSFILVLPAFYYFIYYFGN
jgi:phosphatidate cytidylyltransferase